MSMFCLILSASLFNGVILKWDTAEAKKTSGSTIPIHFSTPKFTNIPIGSMNYTQIDIPGCFLNGSIGEPLLPSYPITILVPPGKQLSDIFIRIDSTIDYSYKIKEAPLLPCQLERPFSMMDDESAFVINETSYASNEPLRSEGFSNNGIHYNRGYKILSVHVYPLEYTPDSEQLLFYEDITLIVDWSHSNQKEKNMFKRDSEEDKSVIRSLVINPEILEDYELQSDEKQTTTPLDEIPLYDVYSEGLCSRNETIDYVIVTSQNLASTTGYEYNWSSLLSHRELLDGFTGRIVTIQDIDACSAYWNTTPLFNDSAARLREFCKDAYLDWGTQYILLGGGWQNNDASRQIVPYRSFEDVYETFTFDSMPCDLYYSNLDGDWFDTTHAVWGGGKGCANDKYTELSVGRLAVWNAQMISNSIKKIIWYDNCADESFLRSAGFLGGYLGWTSTSKQYMEELRLGTGAWSQYIGFEEWNQENPQDQFDTTSCYYDADYPDEASAVNAWKNAINNDEICLISHLDHGSWANTLSLGDGSSLSNSNYFIGTSQACLSGRYSQTVSGASTFISNYGDRGAFSMILNTGYGYGSDGSTYGASQQQHKIFWNYFLNTENSDSSAWRLGDAMVYTKDTYSTTIDTSSHAYCYVWYSWQLFGDPAQRIHIHDDINKAPVVSDASPLDGSTDVSIQTSLLSVSISDENADRLSWTIQTNPNIGNTSGTNEGNGIKTCPITNIEYGMTYDWFVNVTDGVLWTKRQYRFTVEDPSENQAPSLSNISIINGSIDVDISLNFTIELFDPEDDTLYWSINCTNGQSTFGRDDTDGLKYLLLTNLSFQTTYIIWVNISDGHNSLHTYYSFTTRFPFAPDPPVSCDIDGRGRTFLNLSWTKCNACDIVRIERNNISTWSIGEGTLIYNGTGSIKCDQELTPSNRYYYQLWGYNETDTLFSDNYSVISELTLSNHLPILSGFSIANNSMNNSIDMNWTALISDDDMDTINWTITCSNTINDSGIDTGSVNVWVLLLNLSYDRTYRIWVNVSDGFNVVTYWYTFTTSTIVDTTGPMISNVSVFYSDPKDTLIGWELITCTVIDDSLVQSVQAHFSYQDGSTETRTMNRTDRGTRYHLNISVAYSGNHTVRIEAIDSRSFNNSSDDVLITVPPNWDVTEDGICNDEDIEIFSLAYGQTGPEGWLRADVDNNGEIRVYDVVLISNHYQEEWW